MSKETKNPSGRVSLWRLSLGGFSILIVVALVACLVFFRLPSFMIDRVQASSTQAHKVSQRIITSYCPARMSLDDADKVGDEELRASEGDLSASAMMGSFGSVLSSRISPVGEGQTKALSDPDPLDGEKAMVGSRGVESEALAFTSNLYKVEPGAGSTASMVSWATQGDLKGVQGLRCPDAVMEASFLLPSTKQGWTQRLIAYNPSSKATKVTITIHGSASDSRMTLANGNMMTVAPGSHASFDLSAAAPNQDGIYVTATSSQAPVAMMTTISAMSGLESRGSDYATALDPASRDLIIPGVHEDDGVLLLARSEKAASLKLTWLGDQGDQEVDGRELKAGRTSVIDLGKVPSGKTALRITADQPIKAVVKIQNDSDKDQSDFAILNPGTAAVSSALTVPENAKGRLSLVNGSRSKASVSLTGFDKTGKKTGQKKVDLDSSRAVDLAVEDLGSGTAAVRMDKGDQVVWNGRVEVDKVKDAELAGLASLMPSALLPRTATIHAGQDPAILP